MTFISKFTKDFFKIISSELDKENNKKNITTIISYFSNIIIEKFSPYFYTIVIMLIIMFVMNCVQFYYYLKIILKIDKQNMHYILQANDLITSI